MERKLSMDALNLPIGETNEQTQIKLRDLKIELETVQKQITELQNRFVTTETKFQSEVIQLILRGYSNKEISLDLGIKEKTVKYHLTNIFKINGVKSRAQFIAKRYSGQL